MNSIAGKKIAASGIAALVIKGLGAVLSYAMFVAFAHLLAPEEYGRFAVGLNAGIIISAIAGVGFSTGILRYWPQYLVAGEVAKAKRVVLQGYVATALAGLVILAIAVLISSFTWIANVVGTPGFVLTVAVLGSVIALGDLSTNLLRAQGSTFVSMLPRDVLWRVAAPAVAYLAWRFGEGLSGASALGIAAGVLAALTLWQGWHIRDNMNKVSNSFSDNLKTNKVIASLIPLWIAGIIFAMIQQFDVVIVGSLLSKTEAGSYFAAQKTAQLLSLVLIAGGLATAPAMSALFHAGKLSELQALCRTLAIAIAAVTCGGFIFLILTGKLLLSLFDPQYVVAYPILIVIALGAVIDAVSGPNAYLMQMTKFEGAYLKILIGCYALVIAAQFILIPRYGSFGAAMASASGVVLWNILAIVILRKKAGLDPSLLGVIKPPQPRAIA